MTTGDLKNNLRKLHSELKLVNYCGELDIEGLSFGKPSAFLPLLHFVLTEYSLELAQYFYAKDYELLGKSDMKFVQVVYRILRDEFNAKSTLTKEQFFTLGFAERKLQLVTLVLKLCRSKSEVLKPKSRKTVVGINKKKISRNKLGDTKTSNDDPTADTISKKVVMDTNSENFPQPSGLISEKSAKDISVGSAELPPEDGIMKDASSQHVSVDAIPRNVNTCIPVPYVSDRQKNVGNNSFHGREVIYTYPKGSIYERNPSRPSLLPSNPLGSNTDHNECSPMEISYLPVSKENIPPNTYERSNILQQPSGNHGLMFSPIPVTQTKAFKDSNVKSEKQFSMNGVEISSVNYSGNPEQSKHIYVNLTGTNEESNLVLDDENLIPYIEKVSTKHESSVILKYFKTQQGQIEKLQKDAVEREIHVKELAQRNSELSARVMVLETAVTLLQEKLN